MFDPPIEPPYMTQQGEIDVLESQLDAMAEQAEKARADALDADKQATHYKDLFDTAVSERDAFKAENARLREALNNMIPLAQTLCQQFGNHPRINAWERDIEAALAAHEPQEGGDADAAESSAG